ncbi:MAG TPA: transcriptional regulator [Candidatus Cloacimonadota bacterium]|nr:transcriptional regulator [Candidatus Cloacimonadota bacterium]HPS38571.1 transcriptional regulator [Candidatus Cloacimonadota bacterium]
MSLIPNTRLTQISKLDPVVHVPARLMIIKALSDGSGMDCVSLSRLTSLSWGNLSSHLSKLEESGYIRLTKSWIGKKTNTRVELTTSGSQAFEEWAKTILLALPAQLNPELLYHRISSEELAWEQSQLQTGSQVEPLPGVPEPRTAVTGSTSHILWFLPSDHRWERVLPPLEHINQVE